MSKAKASLPISFFMCDIINKIITSFSIFMKRDTFSAIQTFFSVIKKFKDIPKVFNIVVDGNLIYKGNQQYFQSQDINFDIHQVIGLSNNDETSQRFRTAKQIIKRLNRTFQYSYYAKNAFSTIDKANEFMYLFTTYYNFLRNHKSLGYRLPIILSQLKNETNIPKKWNIIINIAYAHDIEQDIEL